MLGPYFAKEPVAAVSRDGSRIACVDARPECRGVWLVDAGTGMRLGLTPIGDAANALSFSCDGRHIAYSVWGAGPALWLCDLEKAEVAVLLNFCQHPEWSPVRNEIITSIGTGGLVLIEP